MLLSRSAFAAGAPLVVCVVRSAENLSFGFTWQDGAIEDAIVEDVIAGVRSYFGTLPARV